MNYESYEKLPVSGQYFAALGIVDALGEKLGRKFVPPSKKVREQFPTLLTLYPVVYLMKCEEYLWANWKEEMTSTATNHLRQMLVNLIASIPEEGIERLDTAFFTTYYRALKEAREELNERETPTT